VGESRREGEKPCGRMAQPRQSCDPITRAASAERNRTPGEVSPLTTICSRSGPSSDGSTLEKWVAILADGHPFTMGGPEGVRPGAKSSGRFLRDGQGRLAAAVTL